MGAGRIETKANPSASTLGLAISIQTMKNLTKGTQCTCNLVISTRRKLCVFANLAEEIGRRVAMIVMVNVSVRKMPPSLAYFRITIIICHVPGGVISYL